MLPGTAVRLKTEYLHRAVGVITGDTGVVQEHDQPIETIAVRIDRTGEIVYVCPWEIERA